MEITIFIAQKRVANNNPTIVMPAQNKSNRSKNNLIKLQYNN
tara:strand:+ start:651 stop:776 length:126 start_codon:yes stop_codon:yes gene_type:complete